ncbi:flagellar hook capping FlgD N-terminal domain-containing protein [Planococcus lenghuensis]|uniref:Flagellar biosynthesis protein FlgD n=1 Tax=Planococcus lenghuensis TaxID=2213202 RepID=A0A1Q2L256_9BACL|nr:flagellar hook capping FlgD N-terminal domain-containing protein [Planococcus lenghuensis]AQQ54127.1 flagellar biosynthesis protein FlgD [Planococcus lenghuensis]
MNVNSPSAATMPAAGSRQPAQSASALGKDAFLQILVTQMKNQNPLEPLKDTEFIGQMAQFSSLEQLTNLNQTMNRSVEIAGKPSLMEQAHLIGNKVFWEQEMDGQLQSGEGVVKALTVKDGRLTAELEPGDIKISLDAIRRIEEYTATKIGQEIV